MFLLEGEKCLPTVQSYKKSDMLNNLLLLSLELKMGISIVNVIEAMLSDYSKLGPLQTVICQPTTRRQVLEDQVMV